MQAEHLAFITRALCCGRRARVVKRPERERRIRVYREAPGIRPGPREESRASTRSRGVLSTAYSLLPSLLRLRQPLVCV